MTSDSAELEEVVVVDASRYVSLLVANPVLGAPRARLHSCNNPRVA